MSRILHCAKLGGGCFFCSWSLDSPCDVSFQIYATKCVRQTRCFRCVPAVSIVLIRAICVGFRASDSAGASAGAAGVSSTGAPRSVSHSPHCAYCLLQGSTVLMRSCLRCQWQARVVLFAFGSDHSRLFERRDGALRVWRWCWFCGILWRSVPINRQTFQCCNVGCPSLTRRF
jgi:hypothetical protein